MPLLARTYDNLSVRQSMGLIDWGKTHWTALLIGLSILAIIIFIVYYFFKPGAYICGAGTTQDKKCGTGGCIKICTGGTTYDCTKHSCVCNPAQGLVQCGDSCCPAGSAQHPDPSDPDKCICCAKSQLCGKHAAQQVKRAVAIRQPVLWDAA